MIGQLISTLLVFSLSLFAGIISSKILNWKLGTFDEFFLGFAITNTYFTIYSIFLPVQIISLIFFVVLITIYLLIHNNWFRELYLRKKDIIKSQIKFKPIFSVFIVVFGIIAFFVSLYSPQIHYDAGLYHIQAIKWIMQYPTVPGLANLHDRFGFNPNIFSFFAGTSLNQIFGRSLYSINFVIVFVSFTWFIFTLKYTYVAKNYLKSIGLLFSIFIVYKFSFLWLSATTPDYVSTFFAIYIILRLTYDTVNYDFEKLIIVLSVYAVTVKLSVMPVLILSGYLFIKNKFFIINKNNFIIWLLIFIIALPWLIKNVIISGWLIFPFPRIDLFVFDWKVPIENVIEAKNSITNWAKITGNNSNNLNNFSWILNWLKNQKTWSLIIIFTSLTLIITTLVRNIINNQFQRNYLCISLFTSLTGIIFWFLTAPDIRFVICFIIPGFILPFKYLTSNRHFLKSIFLALALIFSILFLKEEWFHPWHFTKRINQYFILPYPIDPVLNGKPVKYSTVPFDNNTSYIYPIGSDLCFNQPLPCANCYKEGLTLRKNKIKFGFKITR